MRVHPLLWILLWVVPGHAGSVPEKGKLALRSLPDAQFRFGQVIGGRIEANIDAWLLRAPGANPGMLEMFRVRDRQPAPQLVPWAGEFAGKFLISCVQALRQSGRPELRSHVAAFVAELIATQADDGYLGPFPKERRLMAEWDLWGHYHVMQGLLAWHDFSGDAAALETTRRAADLICKTYLDGTRRVHDAGSHEMNMAVSHVMAELHRRLGEPRYLALVREIEKDWERAGDYARTGAAGIPFYKTPLPRWESLHDLQALVELWRITGDAKYRDAFSSHRRTIREFDVRNSGAFSGGEQATGNAFAPTAIETCCTVAWMAMSVDMLRLHGDPDIAEELERSTFNGALGAQHPGGRWWTYNTPMDGERKASAHDIVFQARAGTPELNCCSVNGPRAPGMLADWAVMADETGIVVNCHAPVKVVTKDAGGLPLTLECESSYPAEGKVTWRIHSAGKLRVRFRIPSWAEGATVSIAGGPAEFPGAGAWFDVERIWKIIEPVTFDFPMKLRAMPGQREQAGKVSLFRGPLLLAWDQADNNHDEFLIPRLAPDKLDAAVTANAPPVGLTRCAPWLLMEVPTPRGPVRLRDFATAGMSGTRYRSWLKTISTHDAKAGEPPLLRASLKSGPMPEAGDLIRTTTFTATEAAVQLNGSNGMLVYALPENFGAGDFTVSVRVNVRALPEKRLAQIFSAWCAAGDDPLRLVIQNGRVFARIEGGGGAGTGGAPLAPGGWHHVAAVKEGTTLTLFEDGLPCASTAAPAVLQSKSKACALGGNPLYTDGPEFLAAAFRNFAVYQRALTEEEIEALAK